jgi:hypothetical protein
VFCFGRKTVLDYGLGIANSSHYEHFEQVFLLVLLLHDLHDLPYLRDFCEMRLTHFSMCNGPHRYHLFVFGMPKQPRLIKFRQLKVHVNQRPMLIYRIKHFIPNIVESKLKLCPESFSSSICPFRSPEYIDTDSKFKFAGLDSSLPALKYPECALKISLVGRLTSCWVLRKLIYMSFFSMTRLRS